MLIAVFFILDCAIYCSDDGVSIPRAGALTGA